MAYLPYPVYSSDFVFDPSDFAYANTYNFFPDNVAFGSDFTFDEYDFSYDAFGPNFDFVQDSSSQSLDNLQIASGSYPGNQAFFGGVMLPDGKIFCVPHNSTTARIYDPYTDTLTIPPGNYSGNIGFTTGILLHNGKVFCVPFNSTSAIIYDGGFNCNLPLARILSAYDNKF